MEVFFSRDIKVIDLLVSLQEQLGTDQPIIPVLVKEKKMEMIREFRLELSLSTFFRNYQAEKDLVKRSDYLYLIFPPGIQISEVSHPLLEDYDTSI